MSTSNSRTDLKRFAARLLALGLTVLLGQLGVYALYGIRTIPEEVRRAQQYRTQPIDILYFGDSTLLSTDERPTDSQTLIHTLRQRLPDRHVVPIAHAAYNMDIFLAYTRFFMQTHNKPHTVIIPVNLRSFSPSWDLQPAWQFEKEKYLLAHEGILPRALLRPLAVFRYVQFHPLSDAAFASTPVDVNGLPAGHVADYEALTPPNTGDPKYASQFQYHYQSALTPTHRKLASLRATARLLKQNGVTPVFYITPIDHQSGQRHAGPTFLRQIEENVALITAELEALHLKTLDLSRLLPPQAFSYQHIVNEHLNEQGRQQVAQHLADFIIANPPRTATPSS